jgi:hypothetical protein
MKTIIHSLEGILFLLSTVKLQSPICILEQQLLSLTFHA